MNSSSRYVPLSLVLFIAASAGSAQAGSTLDPYAHIRPPQSAAEKQQKQLLPLGKKKVETNNVVRSADEVEQPTTYVTMPMGNLSEDKKKGPALFGKSLPGLPGVGGIAAPFKAASAGIVKGGQKIGDGIASGAKASGGMAKKSVTVIGGGFKSTGDKIKDSGDSMGSKLAIKKNKSPHKIASLDDLYTKEAAKAVASNTDGGAKAAELADPKKVPQGINSAFLPSKKSKFSKLNPLGKIKIAKKNNNGEERPTSGFADGAVNPDEEVLAEIDGRKKAIAAAKNNADAVPENEKLPQTPSKLAEIYGVKTTTASGMTSPNSAAPKEKKEKKSKFGGLSIAKLKPSIPSMPNFKKGKKSGAEKSEKTIAAKPKPEVQAPAKHESLETPVAKKVEENDLFESPNNGTPPESQPSMAFKTGDREIDAAVSSSAKQGSSNALAAAKPSNKGANKLAGMGTAMKGGFSKLNFLNKKKGTPAQTATKADAPKQM